MSHLGGSYWHTPDMNTFMEDVWVYLVLKYQIKSVVDVGTGAGWNAKWFLDSAIRTIGIEGDPEAIEHNQLPKPCIIQHDYTTGALTIPETDLAWCSEFVEHVEERFIPNYVSTFKCCRYLCMTHGEPGQDGFHHVNCQTTDYWTKKLLDYGLVIDPEETLYLRSTDVHKAPWGRRTLCFFKNIDFHDHPDSLANPIPNSQAA